MSRFDPARRPKLKTRIKAGFQRQCGAKPFLFGNFNPSITNVVIFD